MRKELFFWMVKLFILFLLVTSAGCVGHHPTGGLVEKQHRVTRQLQRWEFTVQCECGRKHRCAVDSATFHKYNIGDGITAHDIN